MKVDLKSEDETRRERLVAIYDHVGDIAKKISEMDDPLPEQLERSVPNFLEGLANHASKIKDSRCSVVIAGQLHVIFLLSYLHNECICT